MATQQDVLTFAGKFDGTTEDPAGSNQTKFGAAYGTNGVAWCAQFVWFVLDHFKIEHLKSAYTPTVAQWYADKKRGFTDDGKIKPGDLLFFNFPDSLDRIQHLGFATGPLTNGRVKTIEGNTSAGSSGSQDNGGGVFRRDRGVAEIVYIGRPFYDDKEALPRLELPKKRTWLHKGDTGADVRTLQKDLNAWMRSLREEKTDKLEFDFGKIEVDGEFGPDTKKALQTFQMQFPNLEADGVFGRDTERVLERAREQVKV